MSLHKIIYIHLKCLHIVRYTIITETISKQLLLNTGMSLELTQRFIYESDAQLIPKPIRAYVKTDL